jgi:predicted DCC family thiol-disulfide oxidoreductase YuxK
MTGPAHQGPGPAGHGAGRIGAFTVLFDEDCPVCRTARRWLASRAQLVPLWFIPAGSAEARRLFPTLDHGATLRDLTVVGDEGSVYVGDGAWMACLWALADYRGMAERISSPALLPTARRFIAAASAVRESTRTSGTREPHGTAGADYGDGCDDRCR